MNKSILWIIFAVLIILILVGFVGPVFMPGQYSHGPFSFWDNSMGPGHFWGGGMFIFPIIMLVVMLIVVFAIFGRGDFRPPWQYSGHTSNMGSQTETALDILKKRYARGEISKDEFDQMKKDLL